MFPNDRRNKATSVLQIRGGHFIMMRSLYSGVSGLKTHQTKMDVIGNNIANVNTVAYKSQSITFSELMYQTTQSASGPNATTGTGGINAKQIGLGVQAGAISSSIANAGATQTTGRPFDLKITGSSFFVVSNGSDNFFTRDGSFYVDAAGNLAMSSNGYNVMGWQPDTSDPTKIKQATVQPLKIMNPENMTYSAEATSKAYISGILDENDSNISTESGKSMNLQFYDTRGYKYTAKMSFHDTVTPGQYYVQLDDVIDSTGASLTTVYGAASLSSIVNLGTSSNVNVSQSLSPTTVKDPSGTSTSAAYDSATQTYTVTPYSAAGVAGPQLTYTAATISGYLSSAANIATNVTVLQSIFGSSVNTSTQAATLNTTTGAMTITQKTVQGGVVQYSTKDGKFLSVNGSAAELKLDFNPSVVVGAVTKDLTTFSDIGIDLTTSSSVDNKGTSTIGATAGSLTGIGTGRTTGKMSGINIDNTGKIYASYTNGQTKLLGQIAIAEFSNASGLEREGENLYSATLNSGDFDGTGSDISSKGGSMTTGVLEMSNVDLSSEFTEMITTQRGFQANSRIITVSDTLLEELVNLKR